MGKFLGVAALCLFSVPLDMTAQTDKKPEKKFTFVDLQPKSNQRLTDNLGRGTPGNNLTELPQGEQVFADVRFKIHEDFIQLGGPLLTAPQPEKVEGIEVSKKFEKLHILHATGYGNGQEGDRGFIKDGARIAEYRIHYEDKKTEVIPIVYGEDVRDWWFDNNSKDVKKGKVAWKGTNPAIKGLDFGIRLYLCTWINPRADVRVVSIDYVRVGETVAAPFCVAMSLEEK